MRRLLSMTNVRHAITFNNDAQAFIYVYEDFALEKALKKKIECYFDMHLTVLLGC